MNSAWHFKWAMVGLIFFVVFCSQAVAQGTPSASDSIILQPGDSSGRQFGDLLISYRIDSLGKNVFCVLMLNTQLVGLQNLTPDVPVYNFEVRLAGSWAKGKLQLKSATPPQISVLYGDFTYSALGSNGSFRFTGDLCGWFSDL
ncbi:MAG TPA: hypothetical protein DCS93_01375 [Microscillaceae bacterium]|nr:hypothetical protein [Microscillaceae bacterium]